MSVGPADIDAIVYDLGGVLVDIRFDSIFERWSELSGKPAAEIRSRFRMCEDYERYERAQCSLADYFGALRRRLGIELTDDEMVDGWQRIFGEEIHPTLERIRRLAPRVPQYAFSNTNPKHLEYWSQRYAEALRPLRRVFTSCGIGHRKPEPEAFRHVSREIGVPLERILFFDDTQSNVDGARAVGMQGVLVRSHEDVARTLAPWGV